MKGDRTSEGEKKPLRILYLEDNEADHDLVRFQLSRQRLPHELVWAPTLEQFMARLEGEVFDVVLCDSSGPKFDSGKAVEFARRRIPSAAFIFLTGHSPGPAIEMMSQLGADGVLRKDDIAHLGATISRIAEGKRAGDQSL